MAGRRPKATALKILEGNPGCRPLNDAEPGCDMPPVKPSAVAMDELASLEWDRLLAAMPPGIYTALDSVLISQYALAWSMLVKAQAEIDRDGITITFYERSETGELIATDAKVNPAVKIWRAASDTLIRCTDRLGLSPGVRSRLRVPGKSDKPQSRFAGLIGKTQ